MSQAISTRVYDVYGRFYGAIEGLFRRRLAKALAAVPFRDGDRVLDVGVGTGLSLDFYPSNVHVTGIDLSAGMLRAARRKLKARPSWERARIELLQADALNLPFADRSFDVVFLSHVISTVPEPGRCLLEALRVAREGATIVLVNHFQSRWAVVSWVETAIDPICRRLGWRTDLSLEQLLAMGNVEGREKARHAGGVTFRTVYLQKRREGARLVEMSAAGRKKAVLGVERI